MLAHGTSMKIAWLVDILDLLIELGVVLDVLQELDWRATNIKTNDTLQQTNHLWRSVNDRLVFIRVEDDELLMAKVQSNRSDVVDWREITAIDGDVDLADLGVVVVLVAFEVKTWDGIIVLGNKQGEQHGPKRALPGTQIWDGVTSESISHSHQAATAVEVRD